METISRALLTFLLNSLWQIALVAGIAALACRWMRNGPAAHRHMVWVAALIAALLLPAASVRRSAGPDLTQYSLPEISIPAQSSVSWAPRSTASKATMRNSGTTSSLIPQADPPTISLPGTTAAVCLGVYFLFVLFRVWHLVRAVMHTVWIRQRAQSLAAPEMLKQVSDRCQAAFGLDGVALFFSRQIAGPVTAGHAVILPESLQSEAREEVLTSAIGHEMAHVARRDFGCNVLYELLYLPVSFHPGAWLIRRGIDRSREMACDELVTQRLIDAGSYARSIVNIAAQMTGLPRPGYTLGVFDGDILEERIRRLMERPVANLKRARLLLAAGLSTLVLAAIVASGVAVVARAQSAVDGMIAQGDAAYNSGDYQGAADQFENAVRLDPNNVKAKLSLANALLQEYDKSSMWTGNQSWVVLTRQQFLRVLALDSGNQQAIRGMMILCTRTGQFQEAHDWAVKAIQAEPSDKLAYYTAGMADERMVVPEYDKALLAAGVPMRVTGEPIPDPSLRATFRMQHGAQIEDGFRLLQIALQLDPDSFDAMNLMSQLYRAQAGVADSPAEAADLMAKAGSWLRKTVETRSRLMQNSQRAGLTFDRNTTRAKTAPAPQAIGEPPVAKTPSRIRIGAQVAQEKLLQHTGPVYPKTALDAGISGVVRLDVLIGKDGTVQRVNALSGHPLLVPAAMDAVRKWAYSPTLLNGQPVEVETTVDVNFVPADAPPLM
ncbi:MAG TPA: TonB family protein [Bryobacteraceae bacterium]|nr:TonB family protein [Bryobacteraceae bacterium]